MSFILDALRKSEHERQRNKAPEIAQIHPPRAYQKRSIWLPLAALLIGINVSLLALLWFDKNEAPELRSSSAPASITATPQSQEQTTGRMTTNENRSRDLQSEFEPEQVAIQARPRPQRISSAQSQTTNLTELPTYTQMMLDGEIGFALKMDVHVYSETPAERFVFINTVRYREGDQLKDGAFVREINELGVVMEYQGRNFLLARD